MGTRSNFARRHRNHGRLWLKICHLGIGEVGVPNLIMQSVEDDDESATGNELTNSTSIKRLCVTNLELCLVKVTVSFVLSRTSSAVDKHALLLGRYLRF